MGASQNRLLPCPDCGNPTSVSAEKCPTCGRIFGEQERKKRSWQVLAPEKQKEIRVRQALGLLIFLFIFFELAVYLPYRAARRANASHTNSVQPYTSSVEDTQTDPDTSYEPNISKKGSDQEWIRQWISRVLTKEVKQTILKIDIGKGPASVDVHLRPDSSIGKKARENPNDNMINLYIGVMTKGLYEAAPYYIKEASIGVYIKGEMLAVAAYDGTRYVYLPLE